MRITENSHRFSQKHWISEHSHRNLAKTPENPPKPPRSSEMPARKSLLDLLKEEDFSTDRNQTYLTEFMAEKEDIQAALNGHYAIRNIWKTLTKAGRITMRYSTFCRHVKNILKGTPKGESGRSPSHPVASKGSGFVHNPTPNPEDLFN